MRISVIIPTHNPDPVRLLRTLAGLKAQTLPPGDWETIIVDNASTRFPGDDLASSGLRCRLVAEPVLGLTSARRRGFAEACGALCVLVDDDNVLAPDYLEQVARLFAAHPGVGAMGGRSLPEFELPPHDWQREFFGLLALRDLGFSSLISHGLRPQGGRRNDYPAFAPIGAGMAIRREAAALWAVGAASRTLTDRRGGELTSGGDNDIVLTIMESGWEVGYFPELRLIHLIPGSRLDPGYLARLNRGIQKSWVQVLAAHDANPWQPLTTLGAALRQIKAWFRYRAWSSPAARIRWQGACGHFAGRIPVLPS